MVDPHRMMGAHSLLSEGLFYRSYMSRMYRSISLQPAVRARIWTLLLSMITAEEAVEYLRRLEELFG